MLTLAAALLTTLVQTPGSLPPVVPGTAPSATSPRFATAVRGKLRGLPDFAAPAIRDLRPGEPLIVVGQQGTILEVEIPGGMTAWLYGSYVRDGKDPGTVDTIEDGVNLRPEPRSDPRALPIARAKRGQSFVTVGRQGDWVQVVTPRDLHGYVLASDLNVTGDPPSVHEAEIAAGTLWVEKLRTEAIEKDKVRKADEAAHAAENEKRKEADRKDQTARENISQARELLRGVPDSEARLQAKQLLDAAAVTATSEAVNADIKRERDRLEAAEFLEREKKAEAERRDREYAARVAEADEHVKKAQEILNRQRDTEGLDPFSARFSGLGWMTQTLELSRGKCYSITKGGRLLYYVTCPSGRYDLADFAGCEVGIVGTVKNLDEYPARVIEVERIEVVSSR